MDFLRDLNERQLQAVTAPLGPVLILAGAGSGKTRALTYRIAYLIASGKFSPDQILAVTFTNKAANEIKERVEKLIANHPSTGSGSSVSTPSMGTFHSICVRILRREIKHLKGYNSNFTIFDTDDTERALKLIIRERSLEREISVGLARSIISSIKNRQIDMASIEEDGFADIYKAYERMLIELNALDFDDLLLKTLTLFKEHPRVLAKYQDLWPYVLIDEYQDTNNLQYELIKLLVGERGNLFAVGDDAQSIYGFRGANYQNILNFEKDFPNAFVVTLDENYRSSSNILNAANEVIKLSPIQKPKVLWTSNDGGRKLIRHQAIDEVAEAMFVAGEILKLASGQPNKELGSRNNEAEELAYIPEEDAFSSDTPLLDTIIHNSSFIIQKRGRPNFGATPDLDADKLKDIAVLYRTNAQSRVLEESLLRFGIPYHLVGGVRFYERKEIKDILSFLRLILNPKDTFSLERAINVPPRGIGPRSIEAIRRGDLQALTKRALNSYTDFKQKLESIRGTDNDAKLADLIRIVLGKFSLEEYYRDGTAEGESRWENIKELFTVASRFDNLSWGEGLTGFLEEVALYSETDQVGTRGGVTLMTLHQAKGLEFGTVFLVGLEEGILPHMKSLEARSFGSRDKYGGDIAEEIRLAYVGITRAKKNLYMLNTFTRRIFGATYNLKPSRILKVIPDELLEWRE